MFNKAYAAPLAALALIAAAPAAPSIAMAGNAQQNSSATTTEEGGSDAAKSERKICKTFEDTVSRMRAKRLCMTRAQWREFNAALEN